jgi:AmmeMemoRadiSam system protein A
MKAKIDRDASAPTTTDSAAAITYDDLPRLARQTVETFIRERRVPHAPPLSAASPLSYPAACFVSIKTEHGELRGCIGTIEPTQTALVEELIANAVSAATRDPRFLPVTPSELPHLRFSVDVLSAPEPTRLEDLDPATYGVIVTDGAERRRGLLLPAIEGVETVEQQVSIAAHKAGLRPDARLKLYRFRVQRFSEQPETA